MYGHVYAATEMQAGLRALTKRACLHVQTCLSTIHTGARTLLLLEKRASVDRDKLADQSHKS